MPKTVTKKVYIYIWGRSLSTRIVGKTQLLLKKKVVPVGLHKNAYRDNVYMNIQMNLLLKGLI